MELNHSAAGDVSGTVLLRMDLPDGNAAPLLRQLQVGEQARQAGDRCEPLQAVAEDEVRHFNCRAGGGGLRDGVGGVVRPVQPAGAVDGTVGAAGHELRGQCGAECDGAQRSWLRAVGGHGAPCGTGGDGAELQAASLSPGNLSGADLFNSAGGEPSRDSILVPRSLSAGRAAGRGFAVVGLRAAQGPGELRQVQSLPAALPGRRRSGGRGAMAQGGVPDVHELPGRVSAPEPGVPIFPQGAGGCGAEPAAAQGADRAGGGGCGGAAAAGQYGAGKEPGRAADPSAGGARRDGLSRALHPLRRVHEGVSQQCAATGADRGRVGGDLVAGADAEDRVLRAELRALL